MRRATSGLWAAILGAVVLVGCSAKPGPDAPSSVGPPDTTHQTGQPDGGSNAPPDGGGDVPDGGSGGGGTDGGTTKARCSEAPPASTLAQENLKSGSTQWRINRASFGMGAYVDRTSYVPGDQVALHAAKPGGGSVQWTLWRLGYYGGTGGRALLSGTVQLPDATPAILDPQTGAVRAGWPTVAHLDLPCDAPTGVYVVKLSTGDAQTGAIFVVREPKPRAKILINIAFNTYQAYNNWGGTSLYDNFRSDWTVNGDRKWHAFAVSFDRPYARGNGIGNFVLNGDRDLVTFLEGEGYEVGYVSDADLDERPELLHGRTLLVIAGHSEYWTAGVRDAVENANEAGLNLAFLGANEAYWQVRYDGADHSLLYGYKEYCEQDPAFQTDPDHATCRWRDSPVGRPEDELMGEMFGDWVWTSTPLEVTHASAWVWAGAGVTDGVRIPGVFGDESDRRFSISDDDDVVAEGSVEDHMGTLSEGETLVYTPQGRGGVFAAGTLQWCRALAGDGAWDVRIQQATANVLTKMGGLGEVPAPLRPLVLGPGAPTPQFSGKVTVSTVTDALHQPSSVAVAPNGDAYVIDGNAVVKVSPAGVVSLVAGSTEPGDEYGPALDSRFRNPRGIAVGPTGEVYVADSWNHCIKVIQAGVVRVLAGGTQGFADGTGTAARFNTPSALAWSPKGMLLVADTWNQRIRAVTPAGVVTTYAGTGNFGADNGPAAQSTFSYPFGLAVAADGTLHVVEAETGMVRLISPTGTVSSELGALSRVGWQDGPVSSASVSETVGVAVSSKGRLVLLDGASARLRSVESGEVVTLAGGLGSGDGDGPSSGFGYPRGAAFAPDGSLLVVDVRDHALRRVTFQTSP